MKEHKLGAWTLSVEGTGMTSGDDEMVVPASIIDWAVRTAEAEGY